MLGSDCARPPFPSAISGFTPRTNRSCFRATPATSLCVRRKAFSNCVCFSVASCRLLKCDASTGRRSPRSYTSFTSDTEMKWRHPLLIGFRKRTNCLTCWRQKPAGLVRNRSRSRSPKEAHFDESLPIVAATFEWPCTESAMQHNYLSDVMTVVDILAGREK